MLNYYTILRVPENATSEEIKSAYRALAKEYHPDVNPNNTISEEYFKKVNEAYGVLSDPIKRNWYTLLRKGNFVFQSTDSRKYGTRHRYTEAELTKNKETRTKPSSTPYWLKQMVLLLTIAWMLLIIFNNWFTSYEGDELAKMALSYLLFIVAIYFYINNLYNKWRTVETAFNPENRSLSYFLLLFFLTIPAFFAIGYVRKEVHLKFYSKVVEARVMEYEHRAPDEWVSIVFFDEKNLAYKKDFSFTKPKALNLSNFKILVKYATGEPRMTQFHIQLLGHDTIYQKEMDEINRNNHYFNI